MFKKSDFMILASAFLLWRHTRSFEETGPRQTLMRDRVEYAIPFALAGRLVHRLFIAGWLREIFDYRAALTAHLLGSVDEQEEPLERDRALTY